MPCGRVAAGEVVAMTPGATAQSVRQGDLISRPVAGLLDLRV